MRLFLLRIPSHLRIISIFSMAVSRLRDSTFVHGIYVGTLGDESEYRFQLLDNGIPEANRHQKPAGTQAGTSS
jgi:hypothetical protein